MKKLVDLSKEERKELGICSLDLSSSVVKNTGRKYWTLVVNLTPILSVSFSLTQAQFAIISALRTGPELRYSRLRFDGYYRIRKGVNNSQTYYFLEVMAADSPFAVFTCFLKRDQIEEIRILNLESQLKIVENDGDELKETGDLFTGEE